jgi:hypothetical protein
VLVRRTSQTHISSEDDRVQRQRNEHARTHRTRFLVLGGCWRHLELEAALGACCLLLVACWLIFIDYTTPLDYWLINYIRKQTEANNPPFALIHRVRFCLLLMIAVDEDLPSDVAARWCALALRPPLLLFTAAPFRLCIARICPHCPLGGGIK